MIEISIHAPRVGSDEITESDHHFRELFQSTLPVWGATDLYDMMQALCAISIHAPRVGSDNRSRYTVKVGNISIHAPRVGSDRFNASNKPLVIISIHAPRVGSDFGYSMVWR